MKHFTLFLKGLCVCTTAIFFTDCKQDAKSETTMVPGSVNDSLSEKGTLLSVFTQKEGAYLLPWKYLMNVKFEEKYSEKMGMTVSLPLFGDTLASLDGKMVLVEGFYIPVDETGDDKIVILSAFPFSQCFFCGKAGVESIIDVLSSQKFPHLKVDTKIRFRGRLKLNRDNFDFLIYILEDAKMIS